MHVYASIVVLIVLCRHNFLIDLIRRSESTRWQFQNRSGWPKSCKDAYTLIDRVANQAKQD